METQMNIRAAILSGVAAAALAGTVAFAQSDTDSRYGNGPQQSTPTEMQQTDSLNRQSVNGQDMDGPDQAQTVSPQSRYDDQQQQYQNQVQQYQDQRQQYRADSEDYSQNLRAYDLAKYDWYYPQAYTYRYGGESGLQPLYLIAEPSQQLAQVPVEGPGGTWVGRVRNVEIGPDGRPARVEIALNRRVSVWVHPGDLRLDPDEHILYTDLTRGELWGMPGATVVSGPS